MSRPARNSEHWNVIMSHGDDNRRGDAVASRNAMSALLDRTPSERSEASWSF